ncbi:armadillo repeat-containing protein 7 [Prorops nasuta]|uniref:armadillo repeat-containing protein 7 n=1 Tax=Prorops nasuta TaxID=863751 RepID=UPI0034CE16E6
MTYSGVDRHKIKIICNRIKNIFSSKFLMFSTKEKLIRRTGKNGINRYDFLKLLISEFNSTNSQDAKKQVLANLANFAYDPINYGYIRQLKIIDLFLHNLSEDNQTFVRFSIGGICNLCLDPINKLYILRNQGIQLVTSLLSSNDEEIILSSITTLMFLIDTETKNEIVSHEISSLLLNLSNSENKRIKNIATIFLEDFCSSNELERIKANN